MGKLTKEERTGVLLVTGALLFGLLFWILFGLLFVAVSKLDEPAQRPAEIKRR